MSFLKIKDPVQRERVVKEFLAIKKNICANELAEKTGKIELREDLSELFKPVTETQRETQKETQKRITEGLRPIKKSLKPIKGLRDIKMAIEQLPQRLPQQETSYPFLSRPPPSYRTASPTFTELGEESSIQEPNLEVELEKIVDNDDIFGPRREPGKGILMGNKSFELDKGNIIIDGKKICKMTGGLLNLIFSKKFNPDSHTADDFAMYKQILILTDSMHNNNDPFNPHFKHRKVDKSIWEKYNVIKDSIWEEYTKGDYYKKKYWGKNG